MNHTKAQNLVRGNCFQTPTHEDSPQLFSTDRDICFIFTDERKGGSVSVYNQRQY